MDLNEYTSIQDINERANYLWNNGTFLDERIIYNKSKHLIFSMYNFYVEVTYDLRTEKLTQIKALEKIEDWEGYLNSINLDHLI